MGQNPLDEARATNPLPPVGFSNYNAERTFHCMQYSLLLCAGNIDHIETSWSKSPSSTETCTTTHTESNSGRHAASSFAI